jgi:hypothetical protein
MSTNELLILKKGTCPTLTGKSKLSYVIGCNDQNDVFIRIAANTGGGFYSGEWVAVKDIETALTKTPDEVTSLALFKLFKGKSVNSAGFLLAVLKHEGVVETVKGKKRKHTYIDIGRIANLSKTSTKKVTAKKKATPRKRATR